MRVTQYGVTLIALCRQECLSSVLCLRATRRFRFSREFDCIGCRVSEFLPHFWQTTVRAGITPFSITPQQSQISTESTPKLHMMVVENFPIFQPYRTRRTPACNRARYV